MDRARVFEAVLVVALIGLAGLLFLAVTAAGPAPSGWERQTNGTVDYMFVGSNDTLYVFSGNSISALRSNGSILWHTDIPDRWKVSGNWRGRGVYVNDTGIFQVLPAHPIVAERSGHLYLFMYQRLTVSDLAEAKADPNLTFSLPMELMALSPQGVTEWETPLGNLTVSGERIRGMDRPEFFVMDGIVTLGEHDGRLYLYREYCEEVFGCNGTRLFTIDNVACPATVDEDGCLYLVKAVRPSPAYNVSWFENRTKDTVVVGEDMTRMIFDPSYLTSGNIVEACGPDGSIVWSTDIGERVVLQLSDYRVWPEYSSLPLYRNGTLYVPVMNGMACLDTRGGLQWVRHIPDGPFILFPLMPGDEQGNVYLSKLEYPLQTSRMVIIAADGTVGTSSWPYLMYDSYDEHERGPVVIAAGDGMVYAYNGGGIIDRDSFNRTLRSKYYNADTITAYDVRNNSALWRFQVPVGDKHTLTLDRDNLAEAGLGSEVVDLNGSGIVVLYPLDMYQVSPVGRGVINVFPGKNVTYLSYYYAIYEHPIISNRSRCIYARSLYALDDSGRMLWKQPLSGLISKAFANNSSFYYSTGDGRIAGKSTDLAAAGIAIVAAVYLFLRFFALGTITRARGLIDKNENRLQVLRHVTGNPGVTAAEAARNLGINTGTVRYHLFILTLNHKLVTHREGDKFLRYFANAGAYTPQERSLVSLMRRDSLRRTLTVLSRRPGITGPELARELNVSTTAAYRHVSELAEKGIVERVNDKGHGYSYAIKEEFRQRVMQMMGRL